MYMLDQDFANRIAAAQLIATQEMRLLFEANELQAKEMQKAIETELLKETEDIQVAAAVAAFLPLLAEHKAITKYINYTGDYDLRILTPEIMTSEEAGLFAELEFSLNQEQTNSVVRLIEKKCATLSVIRRETEDLISY